MQIGEGKAHSHRRWQARPIASKVLCYSSVGSGAKDQRESATPPDSRCRRCDETLLAKPVLKQRTAKHWIDVSACSPTLPSERRPAQTGFLHQRIILDATGNVGKISCIQSFGSQGRHAVDGIPKHPLTKMADLAGQAKGTRRIHAMHRSRPDRAGDVAV